MPTFRAVEGLTVLDRKGTVLGEVTHVLAHPTEPVVVGIELQPPNAAYVVTRRPRYVALPGLELAEKNVTLNEDAGEWSGSKAERALDFEWEKTVIWVNMPVLTESGEPAGYVADASFDESDGSICEVLLSEGLTADVAVGTRQIDGSSLVGFDGAAVRVEDAVGKAEFSGGLAARAGSNVAVAKVVAGEAGKTAATIGGKAVKAAASSKAAKGAWSVLKDTGKAFRDGMKDEKK